MFDEDQIKTLMNRIYKLSPSRATEVILWVTEQTTLRFANNQIVQTVAEENAYVSIRILHDDRMGRAATNKFDEKSLSRCCEKALELAKNAQPDPDALPLPGAQAYQPVNADFDATRYASAYQMANQVEEMIAEGEEDEISLSGINQIRTHIKAIGNSQGLLAVHRGTQAVASVTATYNEATGWAIIDDPDIRQIDHLALAQTAIEKAKLSTQRVTIDPGEYTVILEPQAVANLLSFLVLDYVAQISPFSGTAVLKDVGFVARHRGEKFFCEQFTLHDDVFHPLQQGIPFDGEGMPRKPVTLVENGVLKDLVHSRSSALKMGAEPTGHGLELPNSYGAIPDHLVMEGGDSNLEEMIRKTDRGLLVTRFWYNRLVDSNSLTVTGMTRDGTFLVENGEIVGAVNNMRLNESLFHLFRNIIDLGKPVRTLEEEAEWVMVVPPIRVAGVRFTDQTFFG